MNKAFGNAYAELLKTELGSGNLLEGVKSLKFSDTLPQPTVSHVAMLLFWDGDLPPGGKTLRPGAGGARAIRFNYQMKWKLGLYVANIKAEGSSLKEVQHYMMRLEAGSPLKLKGVVPAIMKHHRVVVDGITFMVEPGDSKKLVRHRINTRVSNLRDSHGGFYSDAVEIDLIVTTAVEAQL